MSDPARALPRREILRRAATLGAAAVLLGTLAPRRAQAAKPRLDPGSARARQLGYAHDGAETGRPSPAQSCSRCTHFTAVGDGAWGECNVFAEHLVNAEGWCRSFYPRS